VHQAAPQAIDWSAELQITECKNPRPPAQMPGEDQVCPPSNNGQQYRGRPKVWFGILVFEAGAISQISEFIRARML